MAERPEEIAPPVLERLYRDMLSAGERAAKSHLPTVRDAYFACAAMVAKESLALGRRLAGRDG